MLPTVYYRTISCDVITFLSSERTVTQSDIVMKSNGSADGLNGSTGGHKTVISVSGDHLDPAPHCLILDSSITLP